MRNMKDNRKKLIQYLESEHHPYKKLFEEHSDAIYIVDYYGNYAGGNKGSTALYGYSQEEFSNLSFRELIHPEDRQRLEKYFKETLDGNPKRRKFRIINKNGEVKTVSSDAVPIYSEEHEIIGLFVIGKDITEEIEMESLVRQQNEKFRSLIMNSSDIITIIDENHKIIYRSPSTESILGYKVEELPNRLFSISHQDDIEKCKKTYDEVFCRTGQAAKMEMRLQHKNGDWRDFSVTLSNQFHDKEVNGIVVNYRDITEIKNAHREVEFMAYYDHLTKLPNRRFFEENFDCMLAEAKKDKKKMAVMLIDMDRFKIVNDTLGHEAGDRVLKEVAAILTSCLRNRGIAARWAGDEFIILVSDIKNETEVVEIAEEIKNCFQDPIEVQEYELFVTVSIGISIYPDSGDSTQLLMRNADLAMYLAKKKGKNNFKIYTPIANFDTHKAFSLQNDLNKAIEKNQLELYYQPKINTKTNEIAGAEALIRWNHPKWGTVSPDQFIPLAEESGLIIPIGEWVLREVCQQIRKWDKAGLEPIKVSINFSVLQFLQRNLIENISRILMENQLAGNRIEVEITESVILERESDIVNTISCLEGLGIEIALDDFGTGYSSLSYLTKFKFAIIKLDKSFVRHIHTNPDNEAVIQTIIDLAGKLKMKVVAEGVETEEQLHILRRHQCDEYQGYLFSRPQPVREFERLLKKNQLF